MGAFTKNKIIRNKPRLITKPPLRIWRTENSFYESFRMSVQYFYRHIHRGENLSKADTWESFIKVKHRDMANLPWLSKCADHFRADILVVAVTLFRRKSIIRCCCWKTRRSGPLRIGRFLRISTYFWIWQSSRCILLPTLDVAMTDDTYRAPLPSSPHKLQLLYLSLCVLDPRARRKHARWFCIGKIGAINASDNTIFHFSLWFEFIKIYIHTEYKNKLPSRIYYVLLKLILGVFIFRNLLFNICMLLLYNMQYK